MKAKIINYEDELYPESIRCIDNPPQKLYVLGDETILNNECISIVGSRNCTDYGAKMAFEFARDLANIGITVVSGMARGIDSQAHLGAIEAKGKTIAILGSGFNYIYPNKKVYKQILKSGGAVITEYDENTKVFSQGFRDRNRIVAGLSTGTLIIEAKEHSGTGITAEYVKKYKKELFCIPHLIGDKSGVGTNRLLKRGAKLVTSIEDIIQYYNNIKEGKKEENELTVEIPREYRKIYEKIGTEPVNADEIRRKVDIPINEINTILTMLELENLIEIIPGGYIRKMEV